MAVGNKTMIIDWDSIPSLEQALNKIKSRVCELRSNLPGAESKKAKFRRLFDCCIRIWESDISSVYANSTLCDERKFYVYVHLDPCKKIASQKHPVTTFAAVLGMEHFPFYVGKGTGERMAGIDRNETHRKVCQRIRMMGGEPKVFRVKDGLTETEALQCESKLIDIFGLIAHGGILTNLDEGYRSSERRRLYSEAFASLSGFNGSIIVPNLGDSRNHVVSKG